MMRMIANGGQNDEFPELEEVQEYVECIKASKVDIPEEMKSVAKQAELALIKTIDWNLDTLWTNERLEVMDLIFKENFHVSHSQSSRTATLVPGYGSSTPAFTLLMKTYKKRVLETIEDWVSKSLSTETPLSRKVLSRATYVLNVPDPAYTLPLLTVSAAEAYAKVFDRVPSTITEVSRRSPTPFLLFLPRIGHGRCAGFDEIDS